MEHTEKKTTTPQQTNFNSIFIKPAFINVVRAHTTDDYFSFNFLFKKNIFSYKSWNFKHFFREMEKLFIVEWIWIPGKHTL